MASTSGRANSTLTVSKLMETLTELEKRFGKPQPDPFAFRLGGLGMRVIEIPDDIRPVLEVRPHVPMRPGHRAEVNAWLLETFGTRDYSPFARGKVLMWNGHMAIRKSDAVLMTNLT